MEKYRQFFKIDAVCSAISLYLLWSVYKRLDDRDLFRILDFVCFIVSLGCSVFFSEQKETSEASRNKTNIMMMCRNMLCRCFMCCQLCCVVQMLYVLCCADVVCAVLCRCFMWCIVQVLYVVFVFYVLYCAGVLCAVLCGCFICCVVKVFYVLYCAGVLCAVLCRCFMWCLCFMCCIVQVFYVLYCAGVLCAVLCRCSTRSSPQGTRGFSRCLTACLRSLSMVSIPFLPLCLLLEFLLFHSSFSPPLSLSLFHSLSLCVCL